MILICSRGGRIRPPWGQPKLNRLFLTEIDRIGHPSLPFEVSIVTIVGRPSLLSEVNIITIIGHPSLPSEVSTFTITGPPSQLFVIPTVDPNALFVTIGCRVSSLRMPMRKTPQVFHGQRKLNRRLRSFRVRAERSRYKCMPRLDSGRGGARAYVTERVWEIFRSDDPPSSSVTG